MRILSSRFTIIDPSRDFVYDPKLDLSRVGARREKEKSRRLNHRGIFRMEIGVVPQRWWLHRRGARWSRHDTDNEPPRSPPITHVARIRSQPFRSRPIVVTSRYVCHPVLDYAPLFLVRHPGSRRLCSYNTAYYLRGRTRPDADSCIPGYDREIRKIRRDFFWRSEQRRRVPGEGNIVLPMCARVT